MRIPQFTLMSATCDTGHLPSLNFPFSSVSVSAIKQDKAVVLVLEYCFKVTFEAKTSFFQFWIETQHWFCVLCVCYGIARRSPTS